MTNLSEQQVRIFSQFSLIIQKVKLFSHKNIKYKATGALFGGVDLFGAWANLWKVHAAAPLPQTLAVFYSLVNLACRSPQAEQTCFKVSYVASLEIAGSPQKKQCLFGFHIKTQCFFLPKCLKVNLGNVLRFLTFLRRA